MITQVSQRLSIFPLAGALLFPRLHLPLHIFEPRYRAMVSDALARDRRIAMIQPRDGALVPELFDVGCVGRIAQVEALDDGRYNIVLEGIARFRIRSEIDATTPFRQVEADFDGFKDDPDETLSYALRADFEQEARRFVDARGHLTRRWQLYAYDPGVAIEWYFDAAECASAAAPTARGGCD